MAAPSEQGPPGVRLQSLWRYFFLDDVDGYFATIRVAGIPTLDTPENMPWGVREFAVSDPDETLLRFGQLLPKEERKTSG